MLQRHCLSHARGSNCEHKLQVSSLDCRLTLFMLLVSIVKLFIVSVTAWFSCALPRSHDSKSSHTNAATLRYHAA